MVGHTYGNRGLFFLKPAAVLCRGLHTRPVNGFHVFVVLVWNLVPRMADGG